ncbi:MAG: molybdate ABC transporter permease subunit [Verrucomicrobiales bacterium]|nr:molybdate ABC transporter permease subunit [Verrucomicrobiales bacterium]
MDTTALWLTLKLAASTTLILAAFGLPLAWWLATTQWRGRVVVESLLALPLVLPPTVLGFYILMATGPRSWLGATYQDWTGTTLPFSFPGILLASVLFNLPFVLRPFIAGFAAVDRRLIEASWCLSVSRIATFFRVALPLAWTGVVSGIVLGFAHTVGEFGVVLMVGGNIPGVTRTLSIALYDDVQAMHYAEAGRTALWLVGFAFASLCLVSALNRRPLTV